MKTRKEISKQTKQRRLLEKKLLITEIGLVFFVSLFFVLAGVIIYNNAYPFDYNLRDIDLKDLENSTIIKKEIEFNSRVDEDVTKEIETLISRLKPEYTRKIKSINLVEFDELQDIYWGSKNRTKKEFLGFNRNHVIYITYTQSEKVYPNRDDHLYRNARLLCHEILHSIINEHKETEEEIVDGLEGFIPCFNRRELIYG